MRSCERDDSSFLVPTFPLRRDRLLFDLHISPLFHVLLLLYLIIFGSANNLFEFLMAMIHSPHIKHRSGQL